MAKTLTIDDRQFAIAELTLDQAEAIFDPARTDLKAQGRESVVAALVNGGDTSITLDNIGKMPFPTFAKLRDTVLEISGLAHKTEGEAQAPAEA